MKKIFYFSLMLAATISVTSCNKEEADIFDASARSMNVDKIANVMDGEAGE